jgi:hypothetical protein
MSFTLTRRESLQTLAALLVPMVSAACASKPAGPQDLTLPNENPSSELPDRGAYADSVDALFDVFIPAERNADGVVVTAGAREVYADTLLETKNFAALALALGFLPRSAAEFAKSVQGVAGAFRTSMNTALDGRAQVEKPLSTFKDLSRTAQERVVSAMFDDAAAKPGLQVLRAAAFAGFLGATRSDLGLRSLGFPAFENIDDSLACSGYPRTKTGRLIDVAKENLAALERAGDLDDYTYNKAPLASASLAGILNAEGDLL